MIEELVEVGEQATGYKSAKRMTKYFPQARQQRKILSESGLNRLKDYQDCKMD